MGLWEVTEEVMSQAERSQNEQTVPSYAHISHRALKDIPKEYTNPYNCKVRALAFNNNNKVRFIMMQSDRKHKKMLILKCYFKFLFYLHLLNFVFWENIENEK